MACIHYPATRCRKGKEKAGSAFLQSETGARQFSSKEKGSGLMRINKRSAGKGKAHLFCYRGKVEEDVRFVFYYRGMDNPSITYPEKEHSRDHGRSEGNEIT